MSELQGIARFEFDDGKLEEFRRLPAPCMEIVRTKDTGTLQYEICFNDDRSECIVLERHKDSEALIQHAANVGDLMEAILATGSVSGELLGEPYPLTDLPAEHSWRAERRISRTDLLAAVASTRARSASSSGHLGLAAAPVEQKLDESSRS